MLQMIPRVLCFCLFLSSTAIAQDLTTARNLFRTGKYTEALKAATAGSQKVRYLEEWWRLKIKSELVLGRYEEAKKTFEESQKIHSDSIYLHFIAHEVYSYNNDPDAAEKQFSEIDRKVREWSSRYSDAESSVVIGRMLFEAGADPKKILEMFYDRAKRLSYKNPDPYIASAELALDKHSPDVASKELLKALEFEPENPRILFLLARTYQNTDPQKATDYLKKSLEVNPQFVDSLLFSADEAIDAEEYDKAKEILAAIEKINPKQQSAAAYRYVLKNLSGDFKSLNPLYEKAVEHWYHNPHVDFLIGKKLSQKYRFAEGAEFQRKSLKKRPGYLPAKFQLAQDLLRLGQDEEGWKLTNEVGEADGYNIVNHNLLTLHETLKKFTTLQEDNIVLRMDREEAELYGFEAMELLKEAKKKLSSKYETPIEKPVVVEIFPDKADFAIRTFGLPGGDGYLGVCFGRLITANSPASRRDTPSNWKAVLWHEFCHAVTLEKTKNRMPRWLSEGISVYEERQRDPSWGEKMNPSYREMILGKDLTPVSQLSAAFLRPKSALHVQFAYFESSLAVQFLIEKYGTETINRILVDLGAGMPINESLNRYTGSLDALDSEFADYARKLAKEYGKDAEWDQPPKADANLPLGGVADWARKHPDNFWGLRQYSLFLVKEKYWVVAKKVLERSIKLVPRQSGAANAYELLARVNKELENEAEQISALENWIKYDGDAIEACRQLMTIYAAKQDWAKVKSIANRALAIDPLDRQSHQSLALAADSENDRSSSIRSLKRLLKFDGTNKAESHFRLAKLLKADSDLHQAKRHALLALEIAPRYREAHNLLLSIIEQKKPAQQ